MDKLVDNLLKIHEKIADVESFMSITSNIIMFGYYDKLVEDTNLLLEVLNAFSER
jgi:hypothetical protein